MKFSIKYFFSKCDDQITEEIINGKVHFFMKWTLPTIYDGILSC